MSAYILRRVLFMIPTLFGIMLVSFVVVQFAPGEPEMRDEAPVSEPDNCAITRSTGPPGANCTTTNDTSMIPNKVGIMNRTRRRI